MEALKLILDFLKEGDHFFGFIIVLIIVFYGLGYIVRGFRRKND